MSAHALLLMAVAAVAGSLDKTGFVEFQADPSPGLLINTTAGMRPFDPPDPTRPAVIMIHGLNPTPWLVRIPEAERLGEAVGRRGGPPINVLGWDWNGDTYASVRMKPNQAHAVDHGRMLARAILAAGIPPEHVHLIGHSTGAIVAASAARALQEATGRPVAQVTLLDPATPYHDLVFNRIAVGRQARVVHHFWAPGPSGFSQPVGSPGVTDIRVDVPGGWYGLVNLLQSSHLNTARWYVATAGDPTMPGGFNASVFAR